jgi:hypothetical protein
MRRKNNKRHKIFALDFIAAKELLGNLQQVDMLCNSFKPTLLNQIRTKGYIPIGNIKLIPHISFDEKALPNAYRITVKAIYVGKKKALEGVMI